jgi:hypothetical protein
MDERERQWLAVVLAALSEQVQAASLPGPSGDAPPVT